MTALYRGLSGTSESVQVIGTASGCRAMIWIDASSSPQLLSGDALGLARLTSCGPRGSVKAAFPPLPAAGLASEGRRRPDLYLQTVLYGVSLSYAFQA